MSSVAKIYAKHNLETRGREFLILGEARKNLLRKYIKENNLRICDIGSRDGALSGEFVAGNEFWAVDFCFFGHKKGTPFGDPTHINHFLYSELLTILKKNLLNFLIKHAR